MQCIHRYFWGDTHRISLVCVSCARMLQNLVSRFSIKNLTILDKYPLKRAFRLVVLGSALRGVIALLGVTR